MGVLNCQCRTVQMAATVRSTFASLIKSDNPPTYLGKISVGFVHQVGTCVRLSILRSISRRQKEKQPNAICSISAFSARPLLHVGSGKDQGTRFLSYVDAIHGFRHPLKQEDLDRALSLCTGLRGHLRSRFLVLSDDRVLPPAPVGRGKRAHPDHPDHQGNIKRPNTSVPPPSSSSFSARPPFSAGFVPASGPVPGTSAQSITPGTVPSTGLPASGLPSQASIIASGVLAPGIVHSPGVQFPPLAVPGVRPISDQPSDGYQKVKKRRPRKSKAEASVADAAKVPTPTRTAPPKQQRPLKLSPWMLLHRTSRTDAPSVPRTSMLMLLLLKSTPECK